MWVRLHWVTPITPQLRWIAFRQKPRALCDLSCCWVTLADSSELWICKSDVNQPSVTKCTHQNHQKKKWYDLYKDIVTIKVGKIKQNVFWWLWFILYLRLLIIEYEALSFRKFFIEGSWKRNHTAEEVSLFDPAQWTVIWLIVRSWSIKVFVQLCCLWIKNIHVETRWSGKCQNNTEKRLNRDPVTMPTFSHHRESFFYLSIIGL